MHISYFLDFSTLKSFFNSLRLLPELNTQGETSNSKNIRGVPWRNQYRIGTDYWIATNEDYSDEEYSSYIEEYDEEENEDEDDIEEYCIEHLSHKGWVEI